MIHSVIPFGDEVFFEKLLNGQTILCLFDLGLIFKDFKWRIIKLKKKHTLLYFKTTHPEVVGELQGENGNALIIERAGHRAGDVAGYDGDETCRQQPRTLIPQLSRQQEGGDGGQAAEDGRQKHANISDVNSHMKQIQYVVNQTCRHHQTRIHLQ